MSRITWTNANKWWERSSPKSWTNNKITCTTNLSKAPYLTSLPLHTNFEELTKIKMAHTLRSLCNMSKIACLVRLFFQITSRTTKCWSTIMFGSIYQLAQIKINNCFTIIRIQRQVKTNHSLLYHLLRINIKNKIKARNYKLNLKVPRI